MSIVDSCAPSNTANTYRNSQLVALGRRLKTAGYSFTTVTPETHRRVLAHARTRQATSRDVFGWNKPFSRAETHDQTNIQLLHDSGEFHLAHGKFVSCVRYSTVGPLLFAHSGYPTIEANAVFFGPDTYRFLRFIDDVVKTIPRPQTIADIGTGSGAAAIFLARQFLDAKIAATDINSKALRFTTINAEINDVHTVTPVLSDVCAGLTGPFDLIASNPPYLNDAQKRQYRHGGGISGESLSLRIVEEGIRHLSPKGRLALYTGVAIVDGQDHFADAVARVLHGSDHCVEHYQEIDVDVFGEELDAPPCADIDRISVVGIVVGPNR